MSARYRKLRMERMEAREMMAVLTGLTPLADQTAMVTSGNVAGNPPRDYINVVNELPLASLPGAPATIFLDFNGMLQSETVGDVRIPIIGLEVGGWSNFSVPAFDTDGDPVFYSPEEQQQIRFIWASVAEDYAPFNINVTTIDPNPGGYGANVPYLHVAISGGKDDITGNHYLGFAEIGAYADGNDPNVAFVFGQDPSGQRQSIEFIANAVSHEAGHSFGLDHYNTASGDSSRSPIMREYGASSRSERVTWAAGQNDMAVIASNGFGYRPDDHASSFAGATQMLATNVGPFAKGVIEKTSDVDTFRFQISEASTYAIRVNLPTEVDPNHPLFPENLGNLDATLRLYDSKGKLLAQDSDPSLLANLTKKLTAGTYYVQVGSYGQYGDVGQYSVTVEDISGAHVTNSQLVSLAGGQTGVWVTFNKAINASTFTILDVQVNGNAAGAGVLGVTPDSADPKRFLITLAPTTNTSALAKLNISIGPQIKDLWGHEMDQNENGINAEAVDAYFASLGNKLVVATSNSASPTKKGSSAKSAKK